ncbi:hypothetical protein IYR97_23960 (plasmid) [Pseudomonas fulva]|uniref:Immunity protein 52 domain-containing protein n=2 Tax=Pseudomonas putida group TaxID=136845 RepID=A0ABD7BPD8_PSEPU|nr:MULTISPECIES: hypothetical protein [Pseudomonas putida group]QOD01577.1 hypothetical protein ID616_30620 [Pseudomonas putida]QPH46851.1 hypothetical protein IYR97_23960 [Pseudomonas fulva]QPH52024.1 hypothetical protein IZU98_24410 [Pseudomonas fulva]
MQLADAIAKRIEAQLLDSDWSVCRLNPAPNGVRCWMYSISLIRGPRLMGQMNTDFYRDMRNGEGVFKKIEDAGYSGTDLLGPLLASFDEGTIQKDMIDPFMIALGAYIRSTKTWNMLPPLSGVDGIHFLAVDWTTIKGRTVIKPMVLICEAPPSTAQLANGVLELLAQHLSHSPDDLPAGLEV